MGTLDSVTVDSSVTPSGWGLSLSYCWWWVGIKWLILSKLSVHRDFIILLVDMLSVTIIPLASSMVSNVGMLRVSFILLLVSIFLTLYSGVLVSEDLKNVSQCFDLLLYVFFADCWWQLALCLDFWLLQRCLVCSSAWNNWQHSSCNNTEVRHYKDVWLFSTYQRTCGT